MGEDGTVLPSPIQEQFRGKVTDTDMELGCLSPNFSSVLYQLGDQVTELAHALRSSSVKWC